MLKEGAYAGEQDPNSTELIGHEIENLLLAGRVTGEGGNAVIIKISPDIVSPEMRPAFEYLSKHEEESEIDIEKQDISEDKAVKLFKLYLPSEEIKEYELHARTYHALQNISPEKRKEYARVPELSSLHEVTLGQDTIRKIQERLFAPKPIGEKSLIITMEYVDGEDLATIFYKWILEREGFTPEQVDDMNFGRLYEEIIPVLRLEVVAFEETDVPQDVIDTTLQKSLATNTKKIYEYLRKYRFPMPSGIATRIENTLKLMHENKMAHGDAFDRNMMLTGGTKALRENGNLEGQEPYLIDFGTASDSFVKKVDDFRTVRLLKELSISPEEEEKMKAQERINEISEKAELLHSSPKWKDIYNTTHKMLVNNTSGALNYAWGMATSSGETGTENFVIMAKDLLKEESTSLTKDEIDTFLQEKLAAKMTPSQRTILLRSIEWFGY